MSELEDGQELDGRRMPTVETAYARNLAQLARTLPEEYPVLANALEGGEALCHYDVVMENVLPAFRRLPAVPTWRTRDLGPKSAFQLRQFANFQKNRRAWLIHQLHRSQHTL